MKVNQTVYCDVDDTLISWVIPQAWEGEVVEFEFDGCKDMGIPNREQIEALRKHKARGHTIIVWSSGGEPWAYRACELLGILDIVDLTLEKPIWVYDDLPSEEIIYPKSKKFNLPGVSYDYKPKG